MTADAMTTERVTPEPGTAERGSIGPRWVALLALAVLGAGLAIGLTDLWITLHTQWTESSDYSHGYLMLAMALWLAVRNWRADPPGKLAPDLRWLLPALALFAAILLLDLLFVNVPRLFVLPAFLVALAGTVFGHEAARRVLWPGLLLYFAVPGWILLAAVMQPVTTFVVTGMLRLTSIPAYIEENFVYLPAGTFHIADGCSGVNYLVTGMGLALFYGLAFLDTWRKRLLLLGIAIALSLLSNWIRVYIIIVAGYLSDMQHYLVAVDHLTFGWVVFAVMMVPVIFAARVIEGEIPRRTDSPGATGRRAQGELKPVQTLGVASAVALGLAMLPATLGSVGQGGAGQVGALPARLADGSTLQPPVLAWRPVFDGADADRSAYAGPLGITDIYRGHFPRQSMDARLIRYHHSFGGYRWRPTEHGRRLVPLHGGEFAVMEQQGYYQNQEMLIWGWYEVGGRRATTTIGVKLLELRALLDGRRDATAFAIARPCWPDCGHAADEMRRFLEDNADALGWTASAVPPR